MSISHRESRNEKKYKKRKVQNTFWCERKSYYYVLEEEEEKNSR